MRIRIRGLKNLPMRIRIQGVKILRIGSRSRFSFFTFNLFFNYDKKAIKNLVSGSECGSGSGSRSRLLMTKICKIFQLRKKFKFFWSKIALFLSLGLHKGRPSYKTNLQPSKGNTQHFKTLHFFFFFYFFGPFLPAWIRIANADPDPDPADPNQCGSMRIRIRIRNTGFYNCKLLSYPRPVIQKKLKPSMTSVAGFIAKQKYVLFTKTRYTFGAHCRQAINVKKKIEFIR